MILRALRRWLGIVSPSAVLAHPDGPVQTALREGYADGEARAAEELAAHERVLGRPVTAWTYEERVAFFAETTERSMRENPEGWAAMRRLRDLYFPDPPTDEAAP